MDGAFGGASGSDLTQRPWFPHVESAFDRWSELGGVTYQYEPHDDGVRLGPFQGILGTRADIRLAATWIDGSDGTLGLSYFPNSGGDVVLDTGDRESLARPEAGFQPITGRDAT